MWVKNDILNVFFDKKKGGMPVKDNYGFIRAVSVEISYENQFPHLQSLNDKNPFIKKHSNTKLLASGIMQKDDMITPHKYEMIATLKRNTLNLEYGLYVSKPEKIIISKIWLFSDKSLQVCKIKDNTLDRTINENEDWKTLYNGNQLDFPVILSGSNGELEISGSTSPPIFMRVWSLKKYPKFEIVYGWAKGLLEKRIYSGNIILTYKKK